MQKYHHFLVEMLGDSIFISYICTAFKKQYESNNLIYQYHEEDQFFERNARCSNFYFIANLTVFAGNPGDNLIYNAEEVNGVVVSETIFKMEGTMLTNYMKHNYKYDANNQRTEDEAQKWNSNKNRWENNLCIRYTYGNKSMTTEYYKWNSKKKEYILVPEMTVTMDK